MNLNDLLAKALTDDGPVALVLKQALLPVEGPDGIIFPPTFAPPQGKQPGPFHPYNVDQFVDGSNSCLIDSVPSQANRIEPELGHISPAIIPPVRITIGGGEIDLLQVGHRVADALVRFSALEPDVSRALADYSSGDATRLARLAPTSLLFGAWDSRASGVKIPRLVQSAIRASNVEMLTRSSQYFPPVNYKDLQLVEPAVSDDALSAEGLLAVPAGFTHGGVRVKGTIQRDAVINFVTLRSIRAKEQADQLRLYLAALASTAVLYPQRYNLRQGCLLVQSPGAAPELSAVYHDGRREPVQCGYDDALKLAHAAAASFGIAAERRVTFEPAKLRQAIDAKKASKKAK